MCFEIAKEMRSVIEAQERDAAKALRAVPGLGSGPNGLTPDSVKFSEPYRAAKAEYEARRQMLRRFNQWFTRTYKAELRAERAARFAS